MTQNELNKIIENHQHYLNKDIDGWESMRADLSDKNLSGLNLKNANLYRADLKNANLREVDLRNADLRYANLRHADLSNADLSEANIDGADLRYANLYGANLKNTDIIYAKISEDTKIDYPIVCPETGSFIGYKKAVSEKIVKLQICKDAKRSSATAKKCRCSKALVLAIENMDGSDSGLQEIESHFDPCFIYRVGEIAEVYNFDNDRWRECASGIHFFMDRRDAVEYGF
jgi:uncharacterized protein YjbI with pentapeptide repeats